MSLYWLLRFFVTVKLKLENKPVSRLSNSQGATCKTNLPQRNHTSNQLMIVFIESYIYVDLNLLRFNKEVD